MNSNPRIQVIQGDELHPNARWISVLEPLVRETYVDCRPILTREMSWCDRLYLVRQGEAIVGFIMVAWEEEIELGGEKIPCVHLGLGATGETRRRAGTGRMIFEHLIAETKAWEVQEGRRVQFWYTTATPVVPYTIRSLFADVEPAEDGVCSPRAAAIVRIIARRFGWEDRIDLQHPMVLRGVIQDARYSEAERAKIEQAYERFPDSLLKRCRIDETRGDRMLMLCRTPSL